MAPKGQVGRHHGLIQTNCSK